MACIHSRLHIPPLYRHSDSLPVRQEKDDSSPEEQEKNNKEEEGGPQEEKKKEGSFVSQAPQQQQQQQRFPSTARGPFQENSNLSMAINRRRIFSLEPFHQSSIIRSRQKREREDERGEEGEEDNSTGNLQKKTKLTNGKSFPRWSLVSLLSSALMTS